MGNQFPTIVSLNPDEAIFINADQYLAATVTVGRYFEPLTPSLCRTRFTNAAKMATVVCGGIKDAINSDMRVAEGIAIQVIEVEVLESRRIGAAVICKKGSQLSDDEFRRRADDFKSELVEKLDRTFKVRAESVLVPESIGQAAAPRDDKFAKAFCNKVTGSCVLELSAGGNQHRHTEYVMPPCNRVPEEAHTAGTETKNGKVISVNEIQRSANFGIGSKTIPVLFNSLVARNELLALQINQSDCILKLSLSFFGEKNEIVRYTFLEVVSVNKSKDQAGENLIHSLIKTYDAFPTMMANALFGQLELADVTSENTTADSKK